MQEVARLSVEGRSVGGRRSKKQEARGVPALEAPPSLTPSVSHEEALTTPPPPSTTSSYVHTTPSSLTLLTLFSPRSRGRETVSPTRNADPRAAEVAPPSLPWPRPRAAVVDACIQNYPCRLTHHTVDLPSSHCCGASESRTSRPAPLEIDPSNIYIRSSSSVLNSSFPSSLISLINTQATLNSNSLQQPLVITTTF